MGFTQKPPKRPKRVRRKKILRLISRWLRPRPPPKKVTYRLRSPFKWWTSAKRVAFPKKRRLSVVRERRPFPPKGPLGRPSQEFTFESLPWVSASNGAVSRGTQTVLTSQRIINARYKTVGFRSKKRRNLKPLAYDMSLQKWHYGRLQVNDSTTWNGGGNSSFSDFPASSLGTPTLVSYTDRYSDMENILVNKALLKVKDLKVNLAQAFGERKQTVTMIANTVERITRSFRALKRFDYLGAARALDVSLHDKKRRRIIKAAHRFKDGSAFAANTWLEYKFGWLPLLSDVRGAAEALAKFHIGDYSASQVTARHVIELRPIAATYPYGSTGKTTDLSTGTMHGRITFRFRTKASIFGSTPNMGLSDPLLLAWELLPYSFIVDWFAPVGDYLSALTATQGVNFLDGYITYWTRRNGVRNIADVYDNGNPYFHQVVVKRGSYRTEHMHHRRDVYAAFPRPRLPVMKDPFSVDHVVTALALMRQTFKVNVR